jgi:hypothetical protein
MGSKRIKALLLTAILLLLASMSVHAATDTNVLWDTYNKLTGYVLGWFKDFVKNFGEYFFGGVGSLFAAALNALIMPFKAMILWNPDPNAVAGFVSALTRILVPGYILLIVINGVYFIFLSISPSERAKAKSMLQKLVLSMILVSLSLPIYKILLGISGALSDRLLANVSFEGTALLGFLNVYTGGMSSGGSFNIASAGLAGFTPIAIFFIPLGMYLTLVTLAAIVVALRNLIVYVMAALFPLTLFFYFFDYTHGIGKKMWQYTIMSIFTQVIQAFMLAVAIIAVNSAGTTTQWVDSYIMLLVGEGAFFMIIIAPLIMMDVMPWIGAALALVGSVLAFVPGYNVVGGALTAAGGVVSGMGASSLLAGGSVAGLGGAHSDSVMNAMAAQRQGGGGPGGGHGGGGSHGGGSHGGQAPKPPTTRQKIAGGFSSVGKTLVGTAMYPPYGVAKGAVFAAKVGGKGASLVANTKPGKKVTDWAANTRVGQSLSKAKKAYDEHEMSYAYGGPGVLTPEERQKLIDDKIRRGKYGGGGGP